MARTKKKKLSTRGLFVEILKENPHLLERGANQEALKLFQERSGVKLTPRHSQYLANVKSDLKKKGLGAATNGAAAPAARTGSVSVAKLEHLEELIDVCLNNAREINQGDVLTDAVQHLRAARNVVVRHALSR